MRPKILLATFTVLTALSLAACSGGGGGPVSTPATATPTASPTATPTAMPSPVTITNSGSTNTKPYTIVLNANGTGTLTVSASNAGAPATAATPIVTTTTAPAADTNAIFADLETYAPVNGSNVQTTTCTKSASFGTSTTIGWEGATSGDVSCPVNIGAMTLYKDAQTIEADFSAPN